jgi:branched-chain amino acid aminotransferase
VSNELKIWMNGEFVNRSDAKISVFDHGVLYGDGCFEGIRAYNGRIFKLASHLKRLYESAEKIRLAVPYSIEEIEKATRETVKANGLSDAYIRLVITRGEGDLGLHPFQCPVPMCFCIADKIALYPQELYDTGLAVIIAERPRIPKACLDPAIKSCNYLNNILAKVEAIEADVLEAIMLNTEGYVSECTGDNLFIVNHGLIETPRTEAGMLHGITRQFVIDELAPSLCHRVRERMMKPDEVFAADEVFLTGTAAEIIGVIKVQGHVIGDGKVGPVTKALNVEFRKRIAAGAPED